MNSSAVDIKDMLEAYESGASSNDVDLYPIFIGKEPAEPANCITLFEIGWRPPQLTYDPSEKYEYKTVVVRIRAVSYVEGWSVAEKIKDTLHGRAHETWSDSYYSLIKCQVGPEVLSYDKMQRVLIIVEFNVQRR